MLAIPLCIGYNLPRNPFVGDDTGKPCKGASELWWNGGLHAHLDRLERTESNIRDELS